MAAAGSEINDVQVPLDAAQEFALATDPALHLFLDELQGAQALLGNQPLTVRQVARLIAPAALRERVEDREARVYIGFSHLVQLGVLRGCEGLDSKVMVDRDWLPAYEFATTVA